VAGRMVLGALVGLLAPLSVCAPPAGAVVVNSATGRISYLPLNEGAAAHVAAPTQGGAVTGNASPTRKPPLLYHGGPVMHSQAAYAIFWAPSGYAFPSGYQTAIEAFLQHVGADSGKPSNVYSVSAQYTDGSGHATYDDSVGGATTDTTAYPTTETCAPYSGFGESFTACITDAKLEAEVNAVIAAQGWPHGLGAEYYVLLPPHAGSCFESSGKECFDKQFCAYHSFSASPETVYANIGYAPGDVSGCGVGQYPNGNANGNADDTFSGLSHEANESITDPKLNAWYDKEGFENGDECRNVPSDEEFGNPLGGSAGSFFNQSIDGAHYYLQQEWSNDVGECVQRVAPATPSIADPGEVVAGRSASFDGSASSPGSGGIVSYSWSFGDGGTSSGPNPTHTFGDAGTLTVTLTVEDDAGFAYSTSREVTVLPPHHTLTVSVAGPGTVSADSGAISGCAAAAGTCSGPYSEGATVTLTASPGLHDKVEWTGCTRPAADSCEVDIGTSDAGVTATFTHITHILTVAAAGPGSGTVSADSGAISGCAAAAGTCSGPYSEGATVTLIPSPALGSRFVGWSGGSCAGAGNCVVTVGADTTVIATFAVVPTTPAVVPTTPSIHRKKLRCRRGFRKRRVRGKVRCVKVKKRRRRGSASRQAPRALAVSTGKT
jgi:PKD domain/Divergent InlB B-repeat domain